MVYADYTSIITSCGFLGQYLKFWQRNIRVISQGTKIEKEKIA